jgi:hypothetical protein
MAEPLSCPYCNAYVSLAQRPAPNQRITCPRCGERFAYRNSELETGATSAPDSVATDTDSQLKQQRSTVPLTRRPNSAIAGLVLGLMAVAACIGLGFAFLTTSTRREHDSGRSRQPVPPPLPSTPRRAPPTDFQVIAVVSVGAARNHPAGARLLEQLALTGEVSGVVRGGQRAGLNLENLRHVVLGLRLNEDKPDNPLAALTLVVDTYKPYDFGEVRALLRAGPPVERAGKIVYPLKLPLAGLLWRADDLTLAVALRLDGTKPEADLDRIALAPKAAANKLPPDLQPFLQEGVARGAVAWLAGHAENGEALLRALPRGALPVADQEALGGVRAFAVVLELDDAVTLRGLFRCRDAHAAMALRALFERWGVKGPDAVTEQKDARVTLRIRTTPEAIGKARGRIVQGLLRLPGQ